MVIIRPDASERIDEALTLVVLTREAQAPAIREQHLGRLGRILEMLRDSIETRNDG